MYQDLRNSMVSWWRIHKNMIFKLSNPLLVTHFLGYSEGGDGDKNIDILYSCGTTSQETLFSRYVVYIPTIRPVRACFFFPF